jgi:hypothetical protein
LIGLSPLPPSHPSLLQQAPVRPSLTFSLLRGRSPPFGSFAPDYASTAPPVAAAPGGPEGTQPPNPPGRRLKGRTRDGDARCPYAYGLRLKLARYEKSPTHDTKGTPISRPPAPTPAVTPASPRPRPPRRARPPAGRAQGGRAKPVHASDTRPGGRPASTGYSCKRVILLAYAEGQGRSLTVLCTIGPGRYCVLG